jgi:hypothetical protein
LANVQLFAGDSSRLAKRLPRRFPLSHARLVTLSSFGTSAYHKRVTVAYIHADRSGIPANRNCYAAYEGFHERGADVRLFVPVDHCTPDKSKLTLDLDGDALVHGTIPVVHAALRSLGVTPPAPLDYPESLSGFLGRRVWESTLGEVRDQKSWPVFAKPRHSGKAFTGQVVRAFRNLLSTSELPDDYPVWASEVVPFTSEWRVFVLQGEVQDVRPYGSGPYRTAPDPERIAAMIEAYADSPVAFALDVGVADGSTYLVEANDAYSLGTYGLEPMLYAKMIHARWAQMSANTASPSDGSESKPSSAL